MKKIIIFLALTVLFGCSNESAISNDKEEDPLTKEVRNDLYQDTKQIRSIIGIAFNQERNLTSDEELLYNQYEHKYEEEDLTIYEKELMNGIWKINIALSRYIRNDPTLSSDPTYEEEYLEALEGLDGLLNEVTVKEK